jgi:endonuclease/exonuclease/phosphatase family metal-dependent hydrolase
VILQDVRMKFADDDWAFPRPMLAARVTSLEDPAYDFELGIVHLKAQLDDESAARRRSACVKLDAWIKEEQLAKADEDVVVIGDFNDQLTDPQEWNVFGPLLDPADGGFVTLPLEQAGGFTYIPFDSFIDHVHVRGAALHAASSAVVVEADTTIQGYETGVSDHRPVLATLRFAGSGSQ